MVQVIENRSQVRGRVMNIAPHPSLNGYVVVDIAVSDVAPVSGYANLFGEHLGQTIGINVSSDEVPKLALSVGDDVSARIRRAGPQAVFAEAGSLAKA
jgi:hypothetical protein